jgi:hypothetical protein
MTRLNSTKSLFVLALAWLCSMTAFAQAGPWFDEPMAANGRLQAASVQEPAAPSQTMAPEAAPATSPSTVTIPAGTRVLMVLTSPLHTTSGTAGSGIYLETLYPVIVDSHIVIPAGAQIQGVVEADKRPGHANRVAMFRFRFTTVIFPNNFVMPIQGVLLSVPGAKNVRTRDKEGTFTTVDQIEKVVTPAAAGTVGGALAGSYRGFGIGLLPGAGLGAALGLGAVLLKRGDEISLVQGTSIEMILQSPFSLEQSQLAANARYRPQPRAYISPQANIASPGANCASNQCRVRPTRTSAWPPLITN